MSIANSAIVTLLHDDSPITVIVHFFKDNMPGTKSKKNNRDGLHYFEWTMNAQLQKVK